MFCYYYLFLQHWHYVSTLCRCKNTNFFPYSGRKNSNSAYEAPFYMLFLILKPSCTSTKGQHLIIDMQQSPCLTALYGILDGFNVS